MSKEEMPLIDELTIGPSRKEEMEEICAIAKVAWELIHDAMVSMVGDDLHESISGDWRSIKAEQIRNQYRQNPSWVLAVRDGQSVAGFVTFGLDEKKSLGTIRNNAVSPDYQGRGIGTAMYRHVLDLFRKSGMSYATVSTGLDPGHAPARKAYEKVGFDLRREDVTYYKKL